MTIIDTIAYVDHGVESVGLVGCESEGSVDDGGVSVGVVVDGGGGVPVRIGSSVCIRSE